MQAVIAAIAILAGIVRGLLDSRQLGQDARRAYSNSAIAKGSRSLNALAHSAWRKRKREIAARAGFESLAAEREKTITPLERRSRSSPRRIASQVATSTASQAARISQLEAELNNERQNMAEKVALLETAKQTLANQFQALAAEILDQKSRSFSEGSQKELGTLLAPLRDQIKEFREKVEQAQTDSKTGVTRLKTLIGTLGQSQPGIHRRGPQSVHRIARLVKGAG